MSMTLSPINIVLDLETLDTRPSAVILAIGAISFDHRTMVIRDMFYRTINKDKEQLLRTTDDRVMGWWAKQDPAIRDENFNGEISLSNALYQFRRWAKRQKIIVADGAISMWGNGSDFDNVILLDAYNDLKIPAPWHYRYNRCLRTARCFLPKVTLQPNHTLRKHIAIDDARQEAIELMAMLSAQKNSPITRGKGGVK